MVKLDSFIKESQKLGENVASESLLLRSSYRHVIYGANTAIVQRKDLRDFTFSDGREMTSLWPILPCIMTK